MALPSPPSSPASAGPSSAPDRWLAASLLLIGVAAAYANSFPGTFVFDDIPSIVENPSIRNLPGSLQPLFGAGQTVDGRPLLNFTFALNYALGGLNPWGYHAVNILIHGGAALVLMGIVRRTLQLPWCPAGWRQDARLLAAAIALLWSLHPLQTAAVTYVVQRAESLCGLWYLLTLYAFIRYRTAPAGATASWFLVAAGSGLAGMATKEVMVTAPLLVLAYDRLFLASSWSEIWRQHRRIHLTLAAATLPLFWLAARSSLRGGTAEFAGLPGVWLYFLTQLESICHYARLALWPDPLVFDYGRRLVSGPGDVVWPALTLVTLGGATVLAGVRQRPVAFCGLWFFLILAPSSSVVPIVTQTAAEHRFYLPLAAVVTLAVLGLHRLLGRRPLVVLVLAAAGICLALTRQRNLVYHSPLALWEDTVRKQPANPRAQLNLGTELSQAGRPREALARFREAVRLDPGYSDAHNNLGSALRSAGEQAEALGHFATAVRLDPNNVVAWSNYAAALARENRLGEAEHAYKAALRAGAAADVQVEWALVLMRLERLPEAESVLRAAQQANPGLAAAPLALGQLMARAGRLSEAEPALRRAIQLDAHSVEARNSLGYLLLLLGRPRESIPEFEAAVGRNPRRAALRVNLAVALARAGRLADARSELATALAQEPDNALARALQAEMDGAPERQSPDPRARP